MRSALFCAVLLAAGTAAHGQMPVTIDVTGRLHFQWNSTSVSDTDAGEPIASNTFETRRVRVGVAIGIAGWIRGYIEPDYSLGDLRLRQAWMALEIDPAFVIRAGQFKKPFSLIDLTSSTMHPMIERGVRIRGLTDALAAENTGQLSSLRDELLIGEEQALLDAQGYLGYDMGVGVEGSAGRFGWSAGVFNGNGADARDDNGPKSLAARATYTIDTDLPVRVGAGWSRRELRWPADTSSRTRAGNAFEVDFSLGGFRTGWWLLAEVATGTNLATEDRFLGAQGVLSYFHATGGRRIEGVEPMARVSYGDPDDDVNGDAGMLLTPGFNVYFAGRNRLMFNWDVFVPDGADFETYHAGRAQINLYF